MLIQGVITELQHDAYNNFTRLGRITDDTSLNRAGINALGSTI